MRQSSKPSAAGIVQTKINYLSEKGGGIKTLEHCLKFKQNIGRLRLAAIRRPSLQFLNRVIHRFRGYLEFRWQLNPLTIL
jgi:hypothetical protein